MKKRALTRFKSIIFFILLGFAAHLALSQELAVIPGGLIEKGEQAVISGDYVRVRSGPTLSHRIITKVNTGTEATVLERGETLQEINGVKNYWYRIKLPSQNTEGWVYGQFLRKKESGVKKSDAATFSAAAAAPEKGTAVRTAAEAPPEKVRLKRIILKDAGTIKESALPAAIGDLNQNGVPDIVYLIKEKSGQSFVLRGYEENNNAFSGVYSIKLRDSKALSVGIHSIKGYSYPLLSAEGKSYTSLYAYDQKRDALRLTNRVPSSLVAFGTLDGKSPYMLWLRKNKLTGNDGTTSYFIQAAKVESARERLTLKDRVEYSKPLPVKKLLTFDFDADGRDEIVAEVGGQSSGGGIAVLQLQESGIVKIASAGVRMQSGDRFVSLWGAKLDGEPRLLIYSSDPAGGKEGSPELGFLSAHLREGEIIFDDFYPVNKLMDAANRDRAVLYYGGSLNQSASESPTSDSGQNALPFIFIDLDRAANTCEVKKAFLG